MPRKYMKAGYGYHPNTLPVIVSWQEYYSTANERVGLRMFLNDFMCQDQQGHGSREEGQCILFSNWIRHAFSNAVLLAKLMPLASDVYLEDRYRINQPKCEHNISGVPGVRLYLDALNRHPSATPIELYMTRFSHVQRVLNALGLDILDAGLPYKDAAGAKIMIQTDATPLHQIWDIP